MNKNIPPSMQPEGSFPWMLQQVPRPLGPRPIKPKENQRRVFTGEIPMWMPIWLSDNQYCWPDVVLEHPKFEQDGKDWWGTEWVWVEVAGGMMVTPGFVTVHDITKWREEMPVPDLSKVDFEGDAKLQTARYDNDRMHVFHLTEGLFERLHEAMPFEDALMAFHEEPEAVQDFMTAVADFKIELLKKVFEYYEPIDYVIYGDDWGTQRAGFFSNEMFREAIMPQTKRIWDFIHSRGKFIELHSCGLTQQYIEEIIEMGCDAWTPQDINDFDMLTEKYANKITLTVPIAGIDTATTEEEARKLVREFVDKYAPRGRIISNFIMNPDEKVTAAATDELYKYSSAFYEKLREKVTVNA
ncbi:methyltransferase [Alkalibaculum sp. M08DMB]|uniref:Methyltransferase n=1 Tax=Alkalibaculum sporogenes TaxID=2655001 RepID=A0A6A7K579_9FIRM|nr:uroporphyrinogen decarboxylase family protein [Alkalibaculum sporogenes]MPW24407.1 methyltransferase [Alkalibaculum sporogenes]